MNSYVPSVTEKAISRNTLRMVKNRIEQMKDIPAPEKPAAPVYVDWSEYFGKADIRESAVKKETSLAETEELPGFSDKLHPENIALYKPEKDLLTALRASPAASYCPSLAMRASPDYFQMCGS